MDRIVLAPLAPARLDRLAGFQVERYAKAWRGARIRVVGRGHAEIHDAVSFGIGKLLFFPHRVEKPPDAAVIFSVGESLAARFAERVVTSGLAPGHAMLGELVQGIRPVVPVHEVEVRVPRVVGDRAPVAGVLHAVEDGAVAAGRLAEAAAVLARGSRAELAVDERNDLARQVVGVITDRR